MFGASIARVWCQQFYPRMTCGISWSTLVKLRRPRKFINDLFNDFNDLMICLSMTFHDLTICGFHFWPGQDCRRRPPGLHTVIDPFCGAGTVLAVANELGRPSDRRAPPIDVQWLPTETDRFWWIFKVGIPSGKHTKSYWKWPSRNSGFTH